MKTMTAALHEARLRALLRIRTAKERMTRAAEAVLAGHPHAAHLGDQALEELNAARRDLARIEEHSHG